MPHRIILVDDEPDLAEALAEYLERLGHQAEVVATGAGLRASLARRAPDLILLDLRLGTRTAARSLPGWARRALR